MMMTELENVFNIVHFDLDLLFVPRTFSALHSSLKLLQVFWDIYKLALRGEWNNFFTSQYEDELVGKRMSLNSVYLCSYSSPTWRHQDSKASTTDRPITKEDSKRKGTENQNGDITTYYKMEQEIETFVEYKAQKARGSELPDTGSEFRISFGLWLLICLMHRDKNIRVHWK